MVFTLLIGLTVVVGAVLALYGLYGMVRGEVYLIDKRMAGAGPIKLTGAPARRYALFYLFGGAVWVLYAGLRFYGG